MAYLRHYGIKRRSGRYPWGSGENPYQHDLSLLGSVNELKAQGLSESKIAEAMGMTTSQLRARKSIAKAERKANMTADALSLKDKGYSNTAIGEKLGVPESSVRNLLNPTLQERANMNFATADILRQSVAEKQFIDIGVGTELHMGVSRTRLKTAVEMLKDEGYTVENIYVTQAGTGKKTTVQVLAPPGTTVQDIWDHSDQIRLPTKWSTDDGLSWNGLQEPRPVSSKELMIRYGDEGGKDRDGVIELRRGVDYISLGDARYAQVRISVDGTHYLKGMAVYSDDLPDGVNIRFNTNKNRADAPKKLDALKPIKEDADPTNPFGSMVRQKTYLNKKGEQELSALNIVREEGEWKTWSKSLSSQMLSKQNLSLAKKQLGLAYSLKEEEFKEIMSLTNPAVRKKLLESFADDCDAAAVHLKAAALPRQATHVILPIPGLKDNEIYAPGYKNGETVVLIRHPHGGKFEIPELVVNNNSKEAKKIIDRAKDAVGINSKVAERLSGADFDGDTVLVIPNNSGAVKTKSPLKQLEGFDPKTAYPGYKDMPKMSDRQKQREMGDISNLITDMTIKGANDSEIARAVRHSMVVIDAQKHELNYKKSAQEEGIADLKAKYQGVGKGGRLKGASTLISRASSEQRVPERSMRFHINPKTGEKIFEPTGRTRIDKAGKETLITQKSTKLAEAKDARALSSGTQMEGVYADHSNKLKALANKARKAYLETPSAPYSSEAYRRYSIERSSLDAKLNIALKNAPLERQAQLVADRIIKAKKASNPDMSPEDLKKLKGQALETARSRMGAKKQQIEISSKEWEAIQAGAISNSKLTKILNNSDMDKVKQLATPRTKKGLSSTKLARAKSLWAAGYTQAEIAEVLGVSASTISDALS
ncbi:MAG: BPT5 putative transcription factor [Chaetfec virus UA24_144]|nr:MAG: BPT5 putative transcription factor [Chaetfec virus UA24_144]